jgi:hypothetical protein
MKVLIQTLSHFVDMQEGVRDIVTPEHVRVAVIGSLLL